MKIDVPNRTKFDMIPMVGNANFLPIFFKKSILIKSVKKNIKLK